MSSAPASHVASYDRPSDLAHIERLRADCGERGPAEAYEHLAGEPPSVVAEVLMRVSPASAVEILWAGAPDWRDQILAATTHERREQWVHDHAFPPGTVGRLMEHPVAVFTPELTVQETIERLREMVRRVFITYGWVVDGDGRLVGILIFRELLFAAPDARLGDVMLREPFRLRPEMPVPEAMRAVVIRHYPSYPVCEADGRFIGVVRGQTLFEEHAFELSALPGTMVGVEKEERLSTAWPRSLRFRHPWLQINLLTAFLAAGVVGVFQGTIERIVLLAVFLPVLAGQSGNTGCQALAVALRGMTLGEFTASKRRHVISKEAMVGFANGALIGMTAGFAMYVFARSEGRGDAPALASIVFLAMVGSCTVSGVAGALVPLTLKRLGADPATASSIFLTTATDVVSMGLFLGLATWLIR
jgi:magnesium transporter